MKTISALRLGTCAAAIIVAMASNAALATETTAPTVPQDQTQADTKAQDSNKKATETDDKGAEIVVTGIRGSLTSAINKKRNAKEIVDSVVAEDVGKLPDNNVPEALARVTGVQIDRTHGEGTGVTIRGLGDVQTTINGNEAAAAGQRALNLADIPAELLKAVDVYKTRSASQPEGGIAGTVNVELRRPLDLNKGLTVAGSFRETFSDPGSTKSPYASLLLAERFDTPIGEMGFLANGSYTRNNYFETYVVSESPMPVLPGTAHDSLPVALQNTVIPYAVNYGVEEGSIKRPSLNLSYQWRPSDHLDFVLEGSYLGMNETDNLDSLRVQTNDGSGTYSNLVANPDGTVRSLTLTNTGPLGVVAGPRSIYQKTKTDTYTSNFEAHWHSDKVQINFGTQYNWSNYSQYFVQDLERLGSTVTVDFNSPNVPGGGPYVTFPGVDLNNPSNYSFFNIHDQRGENKNTMYIANLDFTVQTGDEGLLRSVQFGARYTRRTEYRDYGYRDIQFDNSGVATMPSLSDVSAATGVALTTTTPDIHGGVSIPTWYHLDGQSLYDNFAAMRSYMISAGASTLGHDWTLAEPATTDPGESFDETEQTFAAYGELNYAFKGHFPIDGTLGLRYVNTWGTATSSQYTWPTLPTGGIDYSHVIYTPTSSTQNYVDLLPSATMMVHFTPKMQLRLSYTHNVQRPNFYDMRSSLNLLDMTTSGRIYAGNPELKPTRENSYDASLEYYFGRGGIVSLGAFLKNQTGFIFYTEMQELLPDLGCNTLRADCTYTVGKSRNAGPGKIFGLEGQVNAFFDFLPGFAKNFGVNVNFTYIPVSPLHLAYAEDVQDTKGLYNAPYTSEYSGNAAIFYDTPVFSARLAYNYRSSYKDYIDYVNPGYSIYTNPTSRLDAAVNYTPFKFITLSVEGTNLLNNNAHNFFGAYDALPVGVRVQARTIQTSARFRF